MKVKNHHMKSTRPGSFCDTILERKPHTLIPSMLLCLGNVLCISLNNQEMCPFVYSRGYWICRCRRQVMTCVTNSFTTLTRSISAWSECKFVKSAGETNRQMQHVERTEFVFIDGLLSWYLQGSAVWNSSLAYRSRGVLFCHAVKGACFPLKLLLLIFLNVSCVFLLLHQLTLLAQMNLSLISTFKNVFALLQNSRGALLKS